MARPVLSRKERQARTRRELLEAAAQVFATKGYHAASVSQIAEAAGYTSGALYSNFAGKERLFLDLIDEHLEAQHADLEQLLTETEPTRLRSLHQQMVTATVRGMTATVAVDERAPANGVLSMVQAWMLTMEFLLYAVRERPELRDDIAQRIRSMTQQHARVITHWLELDGRPCALAPGALALAHSLMIEGLALRLVQDPGFMTAEHAEELVTTLLFDLPVQAGARERGSQQAETSHPVGIQ